MSLPVDANNCDPMPGDRNRIEPKPYPSETGGAHYGNDNQRDVAGEREDLVDSQTALQEGPYIPWERVKWELHMEETARERFTKLAEQWERETGMQSNLRVRYEHPAFLEILAMGLLAVPLILEHLKVKGDWWFPALKLITGEDPVPTDAFGQVGGFCTMNYNKMKDAWLAWGKARGYVVS